MARYLTKKHWERQLPHWQLQLPLLKCKQIFVILFCNIPKEEKI